MMKKIDIDPDWLHEQKEAGRGDAELARELGCSKYIIKERRREYGIPWYFVLVPYESDIDPDWLHEQKKAGRSDRELAKELGCSSTKVLRVRKRFGIPAPSRTFDVDPAWLREQKEAGRSDRELAEELGCNAYTLRKERLRLGIPSYYVPPKTAVDLAWLREQKEAGRSDRELAKEQGCSLKTLETARRKAGIPPCNNTRLHFDLGWLREQKEAGRSDADIAAELGCHYRSVYLARKAHGIPGRAKRRRSE